MAIIDELKADLDSYVDGVNRVLKTFNIHKSYPLDPLSNNIINASFFLILNSLFEDGVRELLKSYSKYITNQYFKTDFYPEDLLVSHVRSVSHSLNKLSKKKDTFNLDNLIAIGKNLIQCSKRNVLFAIDAESICSNEHNVDAKELNIMCKNVGITNVLEFISSTPIFTAYYNDNNRNRIKENIFRDLYNYKKERNDIAHMCSFRRGMGEANVKKYAIYTKKVAICLSQCLQLNIDNIDSKCALVPA